MWKKRAHNLSKHLWCALFHLGHETYRKYDHDKGHYTQCLQCGWESDGTGPQVYHARTPSKGVEEPSWVKKQRRERALAEHRALFIASTRSQVEAHGAKKQLHSIWFHLKALVASLCALVWVRKSTARGTGQIPAKPKLTHISGARKRTTT